MSGELGLEGFEEPPWGDGIPFGLPSTAELIATAQRRRETIRELPLQAWPAERIRPYLHGLRLATSDEYVRRVGKALLLAPSLAICEALLRGERVPRELLDPEGKRRLARRRV
jgi:hypothetical protein